MPPNTGRHPVLATNVAVRRLHWVWASMIQRCHNQRNKSYARYGGKGIVVCSRWRESFADFFDDMGLPPAGLMLERNDSHGPYTPENCTWASTQTQNNNRPTWCKYFSDGDELVSLKELWRRRACTNVSYQMVVKRIRRGWAIDRALTSPPDPKRGGIR